MAKLYPGLYATPFHPRMAAQNIYNAWTERGIFTVSAHFGNVAREALAARFSAVLADISPRGRMRVTGAGAARLLTAALHGPLHDMTAGRAREVYWTDDGGGVRGHGLLARYGEENFVLEAEDTDTEWFAAAAGAFGVTLRDERVERGLLFLAGPFAPAILHAAGLDTSALAPNAQVVVDWKGISIILARRTSPGGFELSCPRDQGVVVFDRIWNAGRHFGLTLMGQDAMDLLFVESGVPASGRDFLPARQPSAEQPRPAALGLEAASGEEGMLVGLELNAAPPDKPAPLYSGGSEVGRITRAAYSHALQRNIALAIVEARYATAGVELTLHRDVRQSGAHADAKVVTLPFLPL